jgi:hypothetical protein
MKRLLAFGIALLTLGSCRGTAIVDPPGSSSASDSGATFSVALTNLRSLREGETWNLWLKREDTWLRVSKLVVHGVPSGDTTRLFGTLRLPVFLDSVSTVMISIDPDSIESPVAPLIAGTLLKTTQGRWSSELTPEAQPGIGNFIPATGAITFITRSADSLQARKEFYFLRTEGSEFKGSLSLPPHPPAGWIYAVWAVDSSFFPSHLFCYGTFEDPFRPDSDSLQDAFPFPGGNRGADLNYAGIQVVVTLEPVFMSPKLHETGPSVFNLLARTLDRSIVQGTTMEMANVVNTSLPRGRIDFRKE